MCVMTVLLKATRPEPMRMDNTTEEKMDETVESETIVEDIDGNLPSGARGATSSSTGEASAVGAEDRGSGSERSAEAAREPRGVLDFARAAFRFCRAL